MDYISDNFVKSTRCVNGKLLTKGGTYYKAIIIPAVKLMPSEVLGHLLKLAQAIPRFHLFGNNTAFFQGRLIVVSCNDDPFLIKEP